MGSIQQTDDSHEGQNLTTLISLLVLIAACFNPKCFMKENAQLGAVI